MQKIEQTRVYCDSSILTIEDGTNIGSIGIEITSNKQETKYYKVSNIKLKNQNSNELETLAIYLSIILSKVINTQHLFIFNDNINAVKSVTERLSEIQKNFSSLSSLQIGWIPNTDQDLFTVDFLSRGAHKKVLEYPIEFITKLGNLHYTEIELPDKYPELDDNLFFKYSEEEGFLFKIIFDLIGDMDKDCKIALLKKSLFEKKPALIHIRNHYESDYQVSITEKNFFNVDFSKLENITIIGEEKEEEIKTKLNKLHEEHSLELSYEELESIKPKENKEEVENNIKVEKINDKEVKVTTYKKKEKEIFTIEGQITYFVLGKKKNIINTHETLKAFKSLFIPDIKNNLPKYTKEEIEIMFNFVNTKKYNENSSLSLYNIILYIIKGVNEEGSKKLKKISFYLHYLKVYKEKQFNTIFKNINQEYISHLNQYFKKRDSGYELINSQQIHKFKTTFQPTDFGLNRKTYLSYYIEEL